VYHLKVVVREHILYFRLIPYRERPDDLLQLAQQPQQLVQAYVANNMVHVCPLWDIS